MIMQYTYEINNFEDNGNIRINICGRDNDFSSTISDNFIAITDNR